MSLKDTKKSISQKFLGVAGIHGIGLGESDQEIRIYASDLENQTFKDTLEQIETEAAPYNVQCIQGSPPKFA